MKVETFVNELIKGAGRDRALRVAESRMKETHPSNWSNIPKGPVFYRKDRRGNEGLNEKHLRNLHGFWENVYYVMRKKLNNA